MAKVLVIEDDIAVSEAVLDSLGKLNLTVELVDDGIEGAERLQLYTYDLCILDLQLPGKTGTEICREYRAKGGVIPILMLTGKSSQADIISGFDCGADDYLTKPLSLPQLNARVAALLRRPAQLVAEVLTIGALTFNVKTKLVMKNGKQLTIMPQELALLEFFMRHPGQTFNVTDLLERVWSSESESSDDAVWQAIARLRKKIDNDANGDAEDGNDSDKRKESFIVNVKRLGYKICDPAS